MENADLLISSLKESKDFGGGLAAAALAHSGESVAYDPSYYKIAYPNGDLPANKGVAADVIVRCYRAMGIDLQVLVHEDMTENFRGYPRTLGRDGTRHEHRPPPRGQSPALFRAQGPDDHSHPQCRRLSAW